MTMSTLDILTPRPDPPERENHRTASRQRAEKKPRYDCGAAPDTLVQVGKGGGIGPTAMTSATL
jgi:hypothetical protein